MTTRYICIAAKGLDQQHEQTRLVDPTARPKRPFTTVISNPGYVQPTLTATRLREQRNYYVGCLRG